MVKINLAQTLKQPDGKPIPAGKEGSQITLGQSLVNSLTQLASADNPIRLFRVITDLESSKDGEWEPDADTIEYVTKQFEKTPTPAYIKGQILSLLQTNE